MDAHTFFQGALVGMQAGKAGSNDGWMLIRRPS
jgi:hypothetical protein